MWSYWRKAQRALGLPATPSSTMSNRSDTNSPPYTAFSCEEAPQECVSTASSLRPMKSSSELHCQQTSPRINSRSAGITRCAICLEILKAGDGHALFTAECSHAFHFSCIALNVRFGNLVCPICRASWKDVPWQAPPLQRSAYSCDQRAGLEPHRNSAPGDLGLAADSGNDPIIFEALRDAEAEQRRLEPLLQMLDQSISNFRSAEAREKKLAELEPARFDDDEQLETAYAGGGCVSRPTSGQAALEVNAVAEECEVSFQDRREKLSVLIHLKGRTLLPKRADSSAPVMDVTEQRAAVDLVAVLDMSGSMAGQKLTLLKRAMRLVVRSLGAADRLSVVAFSSKARRMLPLRCMTVEGRRAAVLAVDSLTCSGGTSISGGLRKGLAVLQQRRHRNPVATVILLSDGQDSFTMRPPVAPSPSDADADKSFPVHTFGLGADHDASALHTISDQSGGTFSFIQAEGLVQDAFAQCIGGLLSVVALKLEIEVEVVDPAIASLLNLETGSYVCHTLVPGRHACIKLGDLYADEDRDLLVNISLPPLVDPLDHDSLPKSTLLVHARYIDPVSGTASSTHNTSAHVYIRRPLQVSAAGHCTPCIDVDRHRNRLQAAHAIMQARSLADAGDFLSARCCLEEVRQRLRSSAALHSGDKLSIALDAELLRIQRSMNDRQVYMQTCGRAYALSAQSCHLRQRATMRGASTAEGLDDSYYTPSMNNVLACSRMLALAVASAADPPALPSSSRQSHIAQSCQGSKLTRFASFDSVL